MASVYAIFIKVLGFGCILLIFTFTFSGYRKSIFLKKYSFTKLMTRKYNNVHSDRWIVVTTIADPTPDVKFLAQIPGWKLVVVGDTKTPINWSYPNCVFLSIEDQQNLGFETVSYLPEKNYARKSAGYLFAIAHGAKVIYETDDDNRPLDMLENFVLEPTMWGLLYDGKSVFNPYRHFGQPTLWPRGYPLSSVGENITTNYRFNHWKTPSIQQGVVNGDPDMDAIFRLTRKQTTSVLNVTFDGRAPPSVVPAGVFSPFNSQNTLFLYDALWALLIPTTTTFRVCDIWRGYWAQRLLWEMGGNLGFFPPNAFQKRNSHSYLNDAMEEKDLYFQTERLIDYLRQWKCDTTKSFFECVVQLSAGMAGNGFWSERDAELTSAWVNDLKTLGYNEPKRIPFGSLEKGAQIINAKVLLHQTRMTPQMTNISFWAVEQIPPLKYSPELTNRALTSHISKIVSYCPKFMSSISSFDMTATISTFPNILLIVVFNFPHYENLHLLETMYSMQFPHIVYCGPEKGTFDNYTKVLQKPLTFMEVDIDDGWSGYNCLTQAMKMNYNVDGYLYTGDDTLLNVWNLHKRPWDKLWLVDGEVLRQSVRPSWHWFTRPSVGLKAYQAAINASTHLDKQRFDNFSKTLALNTGYQDGLYKAHSDIVYVPRRLKDDVIYFLEHFSKFNLFIEIAIPTVFSGIEQWENVHKLPGTYLWYDGKRKYFDRFFNTTHVFLHPVKISNVLKRKNRMKFLCERYFPLTITGS